MRSAGIPTIAISIVLTSLPLHGQVIRELRGPGCARCVSISRVATLQAVPGDTQLSGTDPRFASDSRGRIYVSDDRIQGRIFVFNDRGVYLRTLGRVGNGVGEFQAIRHLVVDRGDSLHVFDDALKRQTVLDPSWRVVRIKRYPGSNRGLVLLPDGRVVVSRLIQTRDRAGLPIHVSDDTGGIGRSFGNPVGFWRSDFPHVLARSMCLSGNADLWAGHFTQYVLERWSIDGTLRESLGRRVAWFEPWISPDGRIGEAAPQSRLTSIACESPRRLWTKSFVADSQWREGLGVRAGESGDAATIVDPNKYYDTVIEVIDPVERNVIASSRFDEALYEFFAPGYAWAVRPSATGRRQYEIWRVRFSPQVEGRR
jgi:hypothetical protein